MVLNTDKISLCHFIKSLQKIPMDVEKMEINEIILIQSQVAVEDKTHEALFQPFLGISS